MVRQASLAVVLGASVLWPVGGMAQTAPPPSAPSGNTTSSVTKQVAPATITHTLAKSLTQNVATTGVAMVVFTLGTGSVISGASLAAGVMVITAVAYPVNEYLWDYYMPNSNLRANNEKFDTAASLWRTTGKYLTFKVGAAATKFVWLYAYTGSVVSTAVMGTASTLLLPVAFFANNMAWDWYDWYNSPKPVAAGAPR